MNTNQIMAKISHLKLQLKKWDKVGPLNHKIASVNNTADFYHKKIEMYIYSLDRGDDVIFNKPL